MRELGQIPGLVSQRPLGRYARATRGDIPGLWDPRRVNQAWPEPVDNALMAYVPGLGTAGSPVGCCGMGALKKPGRKKRAGEKSRKTMKKPAPAIDPKLLLGGGLAVAALVLLLRK